MFVIILQHKILYSFHAHSVYSSLVLSVSGKILNIKHPIIIKYFYSGVTTINLSTLANCIDCIASSECFVPSEVICTSANNYASFYRLSLTLPSFSTCINSVQRPRHSFSFRGSSMDEGHRGSLDNCL